LDKSRTTHEDTTASQQLGRLVRRTLAFPAKLELLAPVLILLLLAACGGNNSNPYNITAVGVGQWADFGTGTGSGFTGQLSNPFQFPTQAGRKSVNYVYTRPAGAVSVGQTVTLVFQIDGDAVYGAADSKETCPCHVGLLIWRAGDDLSGNAFGSYRFFSRSTVPLQPGAQKLSVLLDPSLWMNVWGQSDPGNFSAALDNVAYIGFTFGGIYFAGHGVWTTSDNAVFTIKSYTVQ